jgi:hypothetical protein
MVDSRGGGLLLSLGGCGEGGGRVLVERSVMEQRFEAVMAVVRDGEPVVEVAVRFGVARQTGSSVDSPL